LLSLLLLAVLLTGLSACAKTDTQTVVSTQKEENTVSSEIAVSSENQSTPINTSSAVSSQKQQKTTVSDSIINGIDDAYSKEMEKASTTYDMVAVSEKYTAKWEDAADKYCKAIAANGGESGLKEKHQKEYNAACDKKSKELQSEYNGGSMWKLDYASYKYDTQKAWTLDLKKQCEATLK
ncbi:MAG: hypothetical protein KBS41_05445, partial [Oscillospiraceae bacterium]|nr:hypothetical protein [Candidatus Equicaccousia limihippi]